MFPLVERVRIPVLDASVVSVLLLLTTIGLINRMQSKKRIGEKESLVAKVQQIERELAATKGAR